MNENKKSTSTKNEIKETQFFVRELIPRRNKKYIDPLSLIDSVLTFLMKKKNTHTKRILQFQFC